MFEIQEFFNTFIQQKMSKSMFLNDVIQILLGIQDELYYSLECRLSSTN